MKIPYHWQLWFFPPLWFALSMFAGVNIARLAEHPLLSLFLPLGISIVLASIGAFLMVRQAYFIGALDGLNKTADIYKSVAEAHGMHGVRAGVGSPPIPECSCGHGPMIAVTPREKKPNQIIATVQTYACPSCDCTIRSLQLEGDVIANE